MKDTKLLRCSFRLKPEATFVSFVTSWLAELGIQVGDGIFRLRVWPLRGVLHRLVDGLGDTALDFAHLVIGEYVAGLQVGGKRRNRISTLPHCQLFVRPVERLVVLSMT